jgi:hypothetical protein
MRFLQVLVVALAITAAPAAAQTASTAAQTTVAPAAGTAVTPKATGAPAQGASAMGMSHATRQFWGIISVLILTLCILALCWKTEVLHGSLPMTFGPERLGTDDTEFQTRAGYRRFFSLAQSQMTWWFWVVGSSFIYIAWMTPDFYTDGFKGGLTQQALILLGIGIGTGVGSAIIDQQKQDKNAALNDLADAQTKLRDSATPAADRPALLKKLNGAAKQLASEGFLEDVLSDANGISLHRFQSFAWTVVLGLIFIFYVAQKETGMPELTALELSLLGISATTYLGLKIPEKDTSQTPTG